METMDDLLKINEQIQKLYKVDDELFDILEASGHDSETPYKESYLDMLDNVKDLRRGLHALLDNHNDTIMDIEYALEPLPIKKPIPSQPAFDEMNTIAKLAGY